MAGDEIISTDFATARVVKYKTNIQIFGTYLKKQFYGMIVITDHCFHSCEVAGFSSNRLLCNSQSVRWILFSKLPVIFSLQFHHSDTLFTTETLSKEMIVTLQLYVVE